MSKMVKNKVKKITKKEIKRQERILNNKKLKQWSIDVRNRDGNKCLICLAIKYIHAHHIIPKDIKEFKFDLDNGIALCAKCHRFSRICSAHQNSFVFMIWFMEHRNEQYELMCKKWEDYKNRNI